MKPQGSHSSDSFTCQRKFKPTPPPPPPKGSFWNPLFHPQLAPYPTSSMRTFMQRALHSSKQASGSTGAPVQKLRSRHWKHEPTSHATVRLNALKASYVLHWNYFEALEPLSGIKGCTVCAQLGWGADEKNPGQVPFLVEVILCVTTLVCCPLCVRVCVCVRACVCVRVCVPQNQLAWPDEQNSSHAQ